MRPAGEQEEIVFHEALGKPRGLERKLYLDRACAGDRALRTRLEELLLAHESPDPFLEPLGAPVERTPKGTETRRAACREPSKGKAGNTEQAADFPGCRLGPYHLSEKIGQGGMGSVYRARDERLQREVAIKILSKAGDPAGRARLLREARTAAALNHPHICTVHDVGEAEGEAYIAMELVEGSPLNEALKDGPFAPDQVTRYGIQLADALAHAHERGIVHRDLKGANIILTPTGDLKILDFGLAKHLANEQGPAAPETEERTVTALGMIVGTPAYMSPEQLRGETADQRSDIWGLGVVLYGMAAGRQPFQGQTGFDLATAILKEPPPALPSRVPPGLGGVIQRCLEKEPARRYQEARELREALESLATAPGLRSRWGSAGTRRRSLAAAMTVLLASFAALVFFDVGELRQRLLGRAASAQVRSIAVLPLENLSGDASQDYFADGIQEALITDLGRLGVFKKVIARGSVAGYRHADKPLPVICRELGVDALVTGSIFRSGDRVRVTAHLVRAGTEASVWDDKFERQSRDVLALQNEIVAAISKQVGARLNPRQQAQLARARRVNPESQDAYFMGMFHAGKFTTEGFETALKYFQEAIDKDPGNALPYAGQALVYAEIGHSPGAPVDAMSKARAAALKALELDSQLAEVHEALAEIKAYADPEYDWAGVEQTFRHALELNPNLPQAHAHYGWYLLLRDQPEEALIHMKAAQELSPREPIYTTWLAEHLLGLWYPSSNAARFQQGMAQLRKALELDPKFPVALADLGRAYAAMKRYPDALAAHQKANLANPRWGWGVGMTYALAGQKDKAREFAAQLEKIKPADTWALAEIYALLGDTDLAFQWLEQGLLEHRNWMPWIRATPSFNSLRADPRFKILLHRMNVSPLAKIAH